MMKIEFKAIKTEEELDKVKKIIDVEDSNSYWNDNLERASIILDDGKVIGLLDINIFSKTNSWLDMIELFYEGYGREVIKTIFLNNNNLNEISGDAIYTTIGFWKHIGAEFYGLTDEEIESVSVAGFTLSRTNFFANEKK